MGRVSRVVLDGQRRCMAGFGLKGSFLKGERFIPFENIALFGRFTMLVEPRIKTLMPDQSLKLGSRVYTKDGIRLGWYTNALIDELDGKIFALEYSQGYIGDLLGQRNWVRTFSCGAGCISVLEDELGKDR